MERSSRHRQPRVCTHKMAVGRL